MGHPQLEAVGSELRLDLPKVRPSGADCVVEGWPRSTEGTRAHPKAEDGPAAVVTLVSGHLG